MYALMEHLHRILSVLREAGVHCEVVGDIAVYAHVTQVKPGAASTTRDVDLLVRREDLGRIVAAAEAAGCAARKMPGGSC